MRTATIALPTSNIVCLSTATSLSRKCLATSLGRKIPQPPSLLSLKHQFRDSCLARVHDTRRRRSLNDELVAFEPKVALLFGTVPGLIPGDIDVKDETIPVDAVLTANGRH